MNTEIFSGYAHSRDREPFYLKCLLEIYFGFIWIKVDIFYQVELTCST